jgi:hypothetical protein
MQINYCWHALIFTALDAKNQKTFCYILLSLRLESALFLHSNRRLMRFLPKQPIEHGRINISFFPRAMF